MTNDYSKPSIPFSSFNPYANIHLRAKYEKCKTEQDVIEFTYWCLQTYHVTKNKQKKEDCWVIFNYLYQQTTGKSYQSKML